MTENLKVDVDYGKENEKLCKLIQKGNEQQRKYAERELCLLNEGLVKRIVTKFYCKHQIYEFDDLYQIGMIGLLEAGKRFDISKEFKFSTYAVHYIRGFILNSITDEYYTSSARIPRKKYWKLDNVHQYHDVNEDEIDDFDEIINYRINALDTFYDEFCNSYIKCKILELLEKLTDRERNIMIRYYGLLSDDEGETFSQIAKDYNVTLDRISQINRKALRKLRHPNSAEKIKDFLDYYN